MIPLEQLDNYFKKLTINYENKQINELFNIFKNDFIDNPFEINGFKVKVVMKNSTVDEFLTYPVTFVHLITRKSQAGKRVFDPFRANKIHWIKPILLQRNDQRVKYFEYTESDGRIRDYYWYDEGNFIVIMEKISPDYLIITSFHIDGITSRKRYEKRYKQYAGTSIK